jgi:transposase
VTGLRDAATDDLRELLRLRDRLVQGSGDCTRRLHRLVDLGFPEFKRYVKRLDSHGLQRELCDALDRGRL